MDNAQKAIMIGVGLFITIIIIAAVMLITGMGQNLLNKGSDKVSGISSQLDMTELEAYDNTKVIGSQVSSVVKKYWNDANIIVYVDDNCTTSTGLGGKPSLNSEKTKAVTTADKIQDNSDHKSQSLSDYTSSTGTKSISTSARYKAYLIQANDNTVGVYFVKDSTT